MATHLVPQDELRQQAARLGPFSSDHIEFLMEDFAAWASGQGRTFFVIDDQWSDPPCPDLPLMIDFHALVDSSIPPEQWEVEVRRNPLSVTFIARPDALPYPASRFRWPADTEAILNWVHDERVRLYQPPAKDVYCEGEDGFNDAMQPHPDRFWPLLAFPFFAHTMTADEVAPGQIGVNNLIGFPPSDRQVDWCCEILRTWERRGFLIWWWNWQKPAIGMSASEHTQHARNGFARMDTKPSERCRFPNDTGAEITNARPDPVKPNAFYPIQLTEILEALGKRFAEWPRRVDDLPFVLDGSGQPRFLPKPDALISWYQLFGHSNWHGGRGYVGQSQFFEALRASAKRYAAIEALPHEPPFPDRFYLKPTPEPGDGSALNALLDRFAPETEHDRQLIAALFATAIWGETGGQRPAFLLTADGGRGSGKTALAKMVEIFAGGKFLISPTEDESRIKNRLLTPESLTLRVALIDNIKSAKFSWDFLESLVTANEISGHRLHCGNASRPNNLLWILTVNGASLSTDMAQRVVTIKLDRPVRSGGWEEETVQLIRENHQLILADLIGLLRREKQPLKRYSRWARWESEVLSRLEQPDQLQRLIVERQQVADAEADEAGMIEEYFQQRLSDLHLDTETQRLFIQNDTVYQWFCAATGERNRTKNNVSRRLNQAIVKGKIKRLVPNRQNSGRGYQWNGKNATGDVDFASVDHAIDQRRILGRGM